MNNDTNQNNNQMNGVVNTTPVEQPVNVPQNNPVPQQNNNSSNKNFIITIILVVILVALASGGVVYFLTSDTNNNKNNNDTTNKKEEPEVKRTGKKNYIYKKSNEYNDYIDYESFDEKNAEKDDTTYSYAGTVTCETNDCEFIKGYNKYAIFSENGIYYIYDYTNDSLYDKPFEEKMEGYEFVSLDYENELYGIEFNKYQAKDYRFYILKNKKRYDNIDSSLRSITRSCLACADINIYLKYGYKILVDEDNEETYFYDIDTFKPEYKLEGLYLDAKELNSSIYSLLDGSIYDIKGKKLFTGTDINFNDNKFIVSEDNKFKVYDKNYNLVKESKNYTSVIKIGDGYALVNNNNMLQLLDYNDDVLATFMNNFDPEENTVHTMLSGWYTDNGKYGIYFIVQDDSVTLEEFMATNPTEDEISMFKENPAAYEYYYIPTTKETGKIPTFVGGYAKPVLYLYPTEETKVTVNFEHENMLTTTYPKFNGSWNVLAKLNGDLYDQTGRYYYGLYWEENSNHNVDFSKGFYVEANDAITFLEEKLKTIGLTERESNEFIMYWLPILEKNKQSLVYFELTDERDSYNKLLIDPKPDSLLRIAIHIKKVNEKVNIEPQQLPTFERKGFTAVEWGGVIHN